MEFPHLGNHCGEANCKQLDFLPMKCSACSQIFCKDHIQYNTHRCPEAYKHDNVVPVCPLCNRPIPVKPGESVDVKVGAHMDTDCQSDPAKERRKVYINKCSKKGCKAKEMVRVTCSGCHRNYCLKHRHENDHECPSRTSPSRQRASNSSSNTRSSAKPQSNNSNNQRGGILSQIGASLARERQQRQAAAQAAPVPVGTFQAGLTEQQALDQALRLSAGSQPSASASHTEELSQDEALARALQLSEQEEAQRQARRSETQSGDDSRTNKSSCAIS